MIIFPVSLFGAIAIFSSCTGGSGSGSGSGPEVVRRASHPSRSVLPGADAAWLLNSPKVATLKNQVSGRWDGASAYDNLRQAAEGRSAKRSSYGRAPGGAVRLDPRMLRGMRTLASEGYTFRVTAIAGGSHSSNSRHYAGIAFDVDTINGVKVGYGNPHYRKFMRRCRELGATEVLGPGDRAHSTHCHAAWPR